MGHTVQDFVEGILDEERREYNILDVRFFEVFSGSKHNEKYFVVPVFLDYENGMLKDLRTGKCYEGDLKLVITTSKEMEGEVDLNKILKTTSAEANLFRDYIGKGRAIKGALSSASNFCRKVVNKADKNKKSTYVPEKLKDMASADERHAKMLVSKEDLLCVADSSKTVLEEKKSLFGFGLSF